MLNSYLLIAEEVLLHAREPLTARAIIERAYVTGIVPRHLHGATQYKTLHARLSEDIARRSEQSLFYRTAPGTFFLKALLAEPTTPSSYRRVHLAPPRRKELKKDFMLAVLTRSIREHSDASGRISSARLRKIFGAGEYKYMPWRDVRVSEEYIPVHSFVTVHKQRHLLSYRRGRFRPDTDPLFLPRSLGFGGAVFAGDIDLLYDTFFGVVANGVAELSYGIGLRKELAEQARYAGALSPSFGTLAAVPNRQVHLDVVMSFKCPDDFSPTKSALSSNDLRWISLDGKPNDLAGYETTSRKILELGWAESLIG